MLLESNLLMEKLNNRLHHHANSSQVPFPWERNKGHLCEPMVTDNFCCLSDIRAPKAKFHFKAGSKPASYNAFGPFEFQVLKIERAESSRCGLYKEKRGENLAHG